MDDTEPTEPSSREEDPTSISAEADTTFSQPTFVATYRNRISVFDSCSTMKILQIKSSQVETGGSSSQYHERSSSRSKNDNAIPIATSPTSNTTDILLKRSHIEGMPSYKRIRTGVLGTRRFMRPVYRTTGVTSNGSDFTVNKEPAIPLLNWRGTSNIKYEAIKDGKEVSRASFITLRVSKDKARSVFKDLDGTAPMNTDVTQKNRPFVTLKYKKP